MGSVENSNLQARKHKERRFQRQAAPYDTNLLFPPSSSWDESIKLWKVAIGKLITSIEAHSDKIVDLAIAPNRKILASSSEDKTVKLWRCNL